MPPPPRIAILGAGLSGLTLARTLAARSIVATVYDKSSPPTTTQRHGYGITLIRKPTYGILQDLLFPRKHLIFDGNESMDVEIVVSAGAPSKWQSYHKESANTVRLHRARLESALGEGLDIRWDKTLMNVTSKPDGDHKKHQINLEFRDGETAFADIVIDAMGIHSIARRIFFPNTEIDILPFVVFRGKRKISSEEWKDLGLQQEEVAFITRKGQRLEVKIDDWISDDEINVSYTYSRAAHIKSEDQLHNPDRSQDDAKVIPKALFDELAALNEQVDIPSGFKNFFSHKKVEEDRLLHWLMRFQSIPCRQELARMVDHGVVLVGESVRAKPVLGGYGGNDAIRDGFEIGTFVTRWLDGALDVPFEDPYQYLDILDNKYGEWTTDLEGCREVLQKMHQPSIQDEN